MGRKGSSGLSGREHVFPDVADVTGGIYKGDGKDAVDFFNRTSNYSELIDGMTEDQKNAFEEWTWGEFMGGQQWYGWDNMTLKERSMTQTFDDIIDQSVLSEGIVVTRNASARLVLDKKHGTLDEFKAVEGDIIKVRGNMSTGAASSGLDIGSIKDVEYKIHISGGTKGAGMWIGDRRINVFGPDQREFMTNRDSWYRIGKSTYNKTNNKTTVHLYYQGHDAHDYGTTGRV